jgi:hypothetical protein
MSKKKGGSSNNLLFQPAPCSAPQQARAAGHRAAEQALLKGGRPAVLTLHEWLERRGAGSPAPAPPCKCLEGALPSGLPRSAEAAGAWRVNFTDVHRDTSTSPLYPRAFSLGKSVGVSCATDTLTANFPDEVSIALRKDLKFLHPDLRAVFGASPLGQLAMNARQLFVWHYWGGTHSVTWGAPQREREPMGPIGDWFEDTSEKLPAGARLKVPVTADLTPCPECIGCAARYSACFDLFVFIHGVRRLSRCAHAGGAVPALEVTFLDGGRARAAVAEGRLSAEDLIQLLAFCDALAALEARAGGIRMEFNVETARGCCINAHFKDENTCNTAAMTGLLNACSVHTVPSRAQTALLAGAPFADLKLLRSSFLPFDLDLFAWAALDVRSGPPHLLPTTAAIAGAARAAVGAPPRFLGSGGGGGATPPDPATAPSTPYLAPHLVTMLRASLDALVSARLLERLRRRDVTFRAMEIFEGAYAEVGHRVRAPDMWPTAAITAAQAESTMRLHLGRLVSARGRTRQEQGEAIWSFPGRGGARGATAPSASESGVNLAAVSFFAASCDVLCGPPAEAHPNVLLWTPLDMISPEGPPEGGGGGGGGGTGGAGAGAPPPSTGGGVAAATTAVINIVTAATAAGPSYVPARPGSVLYTRALSAPPEHPTLPWATAALAWARRAAADAGICDPVRRRACAEDLRSMRRMMRLCDWEGAAAAGGPLADWGGEAHAPLARGGAPRVGSAGAFGAGASGTCTNCGTGEAYVEGGRGLLSCGACGGVAYCGKKCQLAHWRVSRESARAARVLAHHFRKLTTSTTPPRVRLGTRQRALAL